MSAHQAIASAPERISADLLPIGAASDPASPLAAAWADLCADLVEENPFFEPWALIPALAAYGHDKVRLASVWSGDRLIGLMPVCAQRFYARLPVAYWASWTHPHCYFAAPLVRRGFEELFFAELFALLCEGDEARDFVRFLRLDRDSPLAQAAQHAALSEGRLHYEAGALERAVLNGGASAEATIAVHIRKKKRKELKRLRNRLDEIGAVAVRELAASDDLDRWIDGFLDLEDASWKGVKGTSLKKSASDAGWFRETLHGARLAGKLNFMRFDLDGRPLAMLVTFLSKGAGYSLKICYDLDYARFSPGVMIELEAMTAFLNDETFRFADSCAAPDHSMINGLWRARRIVTGVNVSTRHIKGRAVLGLCRMLEGARARLPVKVSAS